ncbi:MAG TPA: right-handed parallel beta-helix repeat-containing protein, partial [Flavobacteriales bacterium]|nr:right-handed parallel beta-helix repeat-containing protein [Flavobacteriales bacterium]
EWPLGIAAKEVSLYADLFDRRPHDTPTANPESYHIGGSRKDGACLLDHTGPGWTERWFEADGYGDSVQVRRLRTEEGGFIIKFEREEPFHAQRQIVLIPAAVESIRAKYLEILATELGLVTPEISFIRVIACGQDLGLFLKEERIGPEFMEKHRMADAALFEQGFDPERPDQLAPTFYGDTLASRTVRSTLEQVYEELVMGRTEGLPYIVDGEGAASWLLMRWLEGNGDPYGEEGLFAYRWTTGRILPIYRRARGSVGIGTDTAAPILFNPMTAMLRAPAFRASFNARREKLIEERWKVKERFAAADAAWLPILARNTSLSAAQASAVVMADELLQARLNKDPLDALDRPMEFGAGHATLERNEGPSRYWPSAAADRLFPPASMRLKVIVRRDTVIFPRGSYAIDEDLIIPYGYTVVLEQGARLAIAPGRSVLCLGPLIVRGTLRNPVFIRAQQEGAPFGTFAVSCREGDRCSISGLLISGGNEARINGQYHSGMFSIRGASSTTLLNCVISGSAGEDALNIKGGSALLDHCVFEDGHADLVDLDFVTGEVRDCVFNSGRADSNGDGLDVSGSHVLVEGCRMERMMDKGLSSGEASQVLVRNNRFEGNRLAIASKDLSVVYVQDNTFTGNAIVFGVYRKKPIYGGAHLMLGTNVYEGNTKERDVDALSEIVPQDSLKAEVLKAFGAR